MQRSERFRCFAYDDLIARDTVSLDLTWLRDESLEDTSRRRRRSFSAIAASLAPQDPPADPVQ